MVYFNKISKSHIYNIIESKVEFIKNFMFSMYFITLLNQLIVNELKNKQAKKICPNIVSVISNDFLL